MVTSILKGVRLSALIGLFCITFSTVYGQAKKPDFNVIAFFTAKNDRAHISYVHEANKWFLKIADNIILPMIPRPIGVISIRSFFPIIKWCFF